MAIWFHSKTPDYDWLSNFAPTPFTLDGETWPSVEHYYQAQKFDDPADRQRIRAFDRAVKAQSYGRRRCLAPRADWDAVKPEVMARALRAKFEQDPRLARRLLATGDEELVHESRRDHFWGRDREGQGENRLGFLLMELRAALRADAAGQA